MHIHVMSLGSPGRLAKARRRDEGMYKDINLNFVHLHHKQNHDIICNIHVC